MTQRTLRAGAATFVAAWAVALSCGALAALAKPILMPTLTKEIQTQHQILSQHVFAPIGDLQPPAPPCPEAGMLPAPFSNCGLPEFPATTLPYPTNMAYWGGHIQVNPKVYLVYWGWGEKGAFPASKPCHARTFSEGAVTTTLACDPDAAGKRMADWVYQMGGTQWAGTQTQYYQTVKDSAGQTYNQHFANPTNMLGGVWVDDTTPIAPLAKTNASNPPGSKNTYTDLAAEAQRAISHFGIKDLVNADIVIAQPETYSDPNALSTGYCAFHDYTQRKLEGGIYDKIRPGIAYTNMPYQLAINSGGTNVCGENAVNSGPAGRLDGTSIVLGHEVMETATDPGAEDILGSGTSETVLGGWYDAADANENGDKCAWVGEPLVGGVPGNPNVEPIPGAMGDIKGNHGTTFAVQSLWSNGSAEGAGWCAAAGTDLPTG
jgi:serine protease